MFPIQITQRHILTSTSVKTYIEERAEKLFHICPRITATHAVLDVIPKHNRFKKQFTTHLNISVPGKEIVITKQEHEDIYLSIRDAFNIAEGMIRKYHHSYKDKNHRRQDQFAAVEEVV